MNPRCLGMAVLSLSWRDMIQRGYEINEQCRVYAYIACLLICFLGCASLLGVRVWMLSYS